MARFALIKDGKIERVIVADPAFLATADPAWLAQYDDAREVIAPGAARETATAIETRDAEPGATIDGAGKVTRAARAAEPQSIDDRIAALEAAVAAKAVR